MYYKNKPLTWQWIQVVIKLSARLINFDAHNTKQKSMQHMIVLGKVRTRTINAHKFALKLGIKHIYDEKSTRSSLKRKCQILMLIDLFFWKTNYFMIAKIDEYDSELLIYVILNSNIFQIFVKRSVFVKLFLTLCMQYYVLVCFRRRKTITWIEVTDISSCVY